MLHEFYENHMHKYICPKSLTSVGSGSCSAQVFGSVTNLRLLTISDYYIYSHDKMMKEKMETRPGYGMGIMGATGCVPRPTGLSMITLFSLFVSIKDCPLLWMVVRSQTYYPEHILAYGNGKARYALVVGSGYFRTD